MSAVDSNTNSTVIYIGVDTFHTDYNINTSTNYADSLPNL